MNTLLNEASLMEKSIEISNMILNESEAIRNSGANADIFAKRVDYLQDLVGKDGYMNFNPLVAKDLAVDFQNSFPKNEYGHHIHTDDDKMTYGERRLANHVFESMTSDNLINNTIPKETKTYIDHFELKGYSSPKLSKLLVKIWGEKSDVVSWYTTKCPKKLETGVYENYNVTLSILPHHITGMSYYSPVNHGGDRWKDGWEGSSCMDTIRNSNGENIHRLLPNLLDTYLAIAYLSDVEGYDIENPRYLARTLVRVAKVNENQWVMLGLRTYSTNGETRNVLLEGLKNHFDNFTNVIELRNFYNDSDSDKKRFLNDCNISLEATVSYKCRDCRGTGEDEDGDNCYDCNGTGAISEENNLTPYIDDSDYVKVRNNRISLAIPTKWLEEKGMIEPVAEVVEEFVPSKEKPVANMHLFADTPYFIRNVYGVQFALEPRVQALHRIV